MTTPAPHKLADLTDRNICATAASDGGVLQVFRPPSRLLPSDGRLNKRPASSSRNRDANRRSAFGPGGGFEVTVRIPEHYQVVAGRTVCYNTRRSPRDAPAALRGSRTTYGRRYLVLVEI